MKLRCLILLTGMLSTVASAATAAYTATGGQATFQHKVRVVNVLGTVSGVTSQVRLDPADLAATSGTVRVPVSDLRTGIALRDTHAKSEVALNTARYPEVTFSLDKLTGGRLLEGRPLATTAVGKLTVKGVTKSISVPVKAVLNGDRINVSTQFKFNPHNYGVDYPGSSDSVTVDVQFILVPPAD